jgi:FixJ family two-component response regulator
VTAGDPGCIVLDVHMPGLTGYDVQRKIADGEQPLPVIFVTGYATIRDTVLAIQRGAVDLLTKPVDRTALLGAVSRALAKDADDREARVRDKDLRDRYERLTPREREVLQHLLTGQLNKQAAADLQVAERTIKLHRAHIFQKLEVDSMAGLTRIAVALGIVPPGISK